MLAKCCTFPRRLIDPDNRANHQGEWRMSGALMPNAAMPQTALAESPTSFWAPLLYYVILASGVGCRIYPRRFATNSDRSPMHR